MVAVVVLLVIHTGGGGLAAIASTVDGGANPLGSDILEGLKSSLPWPGEGRTSIVVEGVGRLGNRGSGRPVPIASLAKVMIAYLVLKRHPLGGGQSGSAVAGDRQAAQESSSLRETAPLRKGQKLAERRVLELLLLQSANNVARLLRHWDADSQEAFVREMNREADEFGMQHTTYTGASGVEPTTVSTADDQITMAWQDIRNPVLRDVVAIRSTRILGVAEAVNNTNRLLKLPAVVGLKTGASTPAGGNLMWAVRVASGARQYLVRGVVLGEHPGATPEQGLDAAFARSEALIAAIRQALSGAIDGARW
ncbi:D-alanyl-D-alanine carboxypeptidase family protein [Streptomyces sp. NPDC020800]|uniref:D-alanyl-D-alanine carboxypeptidase family protein n=1 Tax=Streptomyces sp. NPDC020800 TaxID=3365092 RepID=UPI00379B1B96